MESLPRKKTPLPKLQVAILLYLQLAEPITSTVVYPFVNQLVRETGVTGGDEHKTGYFAGLIESSFYAMEALCVMHWGRASDRLGRKPILLSGLCGLTISMLGFGLSTKYWTLVLSRCAEGALNGNIGVTKSMMAEITDESNRAQGFAYMPLIWVLGCTIGPIIGGLLSRPADRWPQLFRSNFWTQYPYFLPCITAAAYSVSAFIFALTGLKETLLPSLRRAKASPASGYTAVDTVEERPLLDETSQQWTDASAENQDSKFSDEEDDQKDMEAKSARVEEFEVIDSPNVETGEVLQAYTTLRSILIPRVLYPILNYAFLAFVDQSIMVLVPLMYSTPVADGGLGFDPFTIGAIQGATGIIGGAVQIYTFPWMHEKLGTKQLYIYGYAAFLPCLCAFPVLRHVTRLAGQVTALSWLAVVVQQIAYSGTFMTYGCLYMYISDGAPHQSALGLTNGLAQTTASIVRTFAPSTATSLFALSQGYNLLNGTLVYWILCLFTVGGLLSSRYLPSELRSRL